MRVRVGVRIWVRVKVGLRVRVRLRVYHGWGKDRSWLG